MLHREKKSLYNVKNLLTKFRGDDAFILCGSLNNPQYDERIFDIEPVYRKLSTLKPHLSNTKSPTRSPPDRDPLSTSEKSNGDGYKSVDGSMNGQRIVGTQEAALEDAMAVEDSTHDEPQATEPYNGEPVALGLTLTAKSNEPGLEEHDHTAISEGIDNQDAAVAQEASVEKVPTPNEGRDIRSNHDPSQPSQERAHAHTPSTRPTDSNPVPDIVTAPDSSPKDNALPSPESLKEEPSTADGDDEHDKTSAATNEPKAETQDVSMIDEDEDEQAGDESQPEPRRMRTRAQAQAASDNSAHSRTRTPSPAPWVPPVIHPLYLIPDSARIDRDYGLPPNEAEDTRRLLVAYVQKQEEVVRGAEKLYEGLLRAERMRQTVFKWCKAEGHIGEMSDGEDWYDKEEWGLEEDLKKGHDDEEEDTAEKGKKTRKTRQQ